MDVRLSDGAQAFVAGLRLCGIGYELRDSIVVFVITPVVGAHVGQPIETGVELNELEGWPIAPPHWVHLPTGIAVGPTNSQPSALAGWLKHSRNAPGWGNAKEPVQAWLAHVQSVLGMAQAA